MDDFLEYTDEDNRDLMSDEMHARWAVQKIGTLDTAHSEQPFFIGIGFVRPHTPLYAPKRFFGMFPLEELELSAIQQGDAADTHYKDIYPADIKGLRYYRTKNWRYIRYMDGSEELYDHINDPFEWVNLAEVQQFSDTLAILRQQMMGSSGHHRVSGRQ